MSDTEGEQTSLSRDSVKIGDEELRMYGPNEDDLKWPSVTEVLNARNSDDDKYQGWKNFYDGSGDKPHWRDIRDFAGYRGTLAHYKALDPLADYEVAGEEEREAYEELRGWEYRHEDALSKVKDDVEWFVDVFEEICEEQSIDEDSVRAVEKMVVNRDLGYAGQFDLAWDRRDGTTVLGDLKASKADDESDLIRKKFPRYALQLTAYAKAVNFEVDELAVIWISPDSRSYAVVDDSQWPQDRAEYEAEFLELTETVHQQKLEDYYD